MSGDMQLSQAQTPRAGHSGGTQWAPGERQAEQMPSPTLTPVIGRIYLAACERRAFDLVTVTR
jgi:hypothetical protein